MIQILYFDVPRIYIYFLNFNFGYSKVRTPPKRIPKTSGRSLFSQAKNW